MNPCSDMSRVTSRVSHVSCNATPTRPDPTRPEYLYLTSVERALTTAALHTYLSVDAMPELDTIAHLDFVPMCDEDDCPRAAIGIDHCRWCDTSTFMCGPCHDEMVRLILDPLWDVYCGYCNHIYTSPDDLDWWPL